MYGRRRPKWFFSGGVNRIAIQDTIERFEEREGCKVNTIYNGCGILVGQMKTGEIPDAYFACDVSFMTEVGDMFMDITDVSQTDMVILVQKGSPKDIHSLEDLSQLGLRLGVANEQQSALGALTKRLLQEMDLYDSVYKNVRSQTPTADLLVNQILTGSLDAVIVYEANTSQVRDKLELIRIGHPSAQAIQSYAVAKESKHKHLMNRLFKAIRSAESEKQFQPAGFRWLENEGN